MWETARFYFNHTSDLTDQLNEWMKYHEVVQIRNYRHEASDDEHKGKFIWLFDFKPFGS